MSAGLGRCYRVGFCDIRHNFCNDCDKLLLFDWVRLLVAQLLESIHSRLQVGLSRLRRVIQDILDLVDGLDVGWVGWDNVIEGLNNLGWLLVRLQRFWLRCLVLTWLIF